MVHFEPNIVIPKETQVYINLLIVYVCLLTFVLFLLFIAVLFVGTMIYQLNVAIRMQSKMSRVDDREHARKAESKKE